MQCAVLSVVHGPTNAKVPVAPASFLYDVPSSANKQRLDLLAVTASVVISLIPLGKEKKEGTIVGHAQKDARWQKSPHLLPEPV